MNTNIVNKIQNSLIIKSKYFFVVSNYIIGLSFFFFLFFSSIGLGLGLRLYDNTDLQQGDYFKILFIHVPCAWTCIWIYIIMCICSILYYIFKYPFCALASLPMYYLGLFFTFITLITGSLWGYPTWGSYWVWDVRLTSVLILFFFYLCYGVIRFSFKNSEKGSRMGALFIIIGTLNIPVIKYSVSWWNTLHQPASMSFNVMSFLDMNLIMALVFIIISLFFFSLIITLYTLQFEIHQYKYNKLKTFYI
uniref:ABC transporter subunit C n=1 Tax=Meteora sporadica TaxID=2913902 RepID=UPI003002738A|nr:ABC transporter subunit C [Meteora sporadica]